MKEKACVCCPKWQSSSVVTGEQEELVAIGVGKIGAICLPTAFAQGDVIETSGRLMRALTAMKVFIFNGESCRLVGLTLISP